MNKNLERKNRLRVDLFLILVFVILAIYFSRIGLVKEILSSFKNFEILSSFLSGLFFTSAFTTAFSIAFFVELSGYVNIFVLALFGATGALIGDSVLFYFIKDRFSEDVMYITGQGGGKIRKIFKTKLFKFFSPFLAGLIIASPLPDELGIALLGFGKAKTKTFLIFSFTANFLGILFISGLSRLF